MGFRVGAYAKVWQVENVSGTCTRCRISISRKNKETGEYDQDFSGYVSFVGTGCATKAAQLREGDTIKLGDVDATTRYDKVKKVTYYNYAVFSFENDLDKQKPKEAKSADAKGEEGFSDLDINDDGLPF